MKQNLVAVAVTAALVGCGNPVTNSTSTDQSTQSSLESAMQWTKKIVRGWTAKATMQIPAQGAIADALLDPKFGGGRMNGALIREYAPVFAKGNFVQAMQNVGPGLGDSKGLEGKENPYLIPVAAVVAAYRGWQIDPIGGFDGPAASSSDIKSYLGFQEASVEYTNALFTQIAMQLNEDAGVLEDPETAKVEIQRIYKSIPRATLKKMWTDAIVAADSRHRLLDLTGTHGVDWSADGGSYSGEADGLTWTKAGVTWFGKGALSGKQWTIGLESSISKSHDKSSSGSESVSGSTGENTGAGAQPK